MSDGTDPAPDLQVDGREYQYISSPLDIDEDGEDDIEYAATKDNLRQVFTDLSVKITDKDHLLVFVVDHGAYSEDLKTSYINLWGTEILLPEELSDMVNGINTGYLTFILGQCSAGGFEKFLQKDNRIILTACEEKQSSYCRPEDQYDEFVYQFTSALAGYTPYDEPVDADYNGDGTASQTGCPAI